MKKQLSSLDLHYLVRELKQIENSRIDKIYHPENDQIVFSLYKTNDGKKLLQLNIGQSVFLLYKKENYVDTLGFGQLLRKHLDGFFLESIEQIVPERILKLVFKTKELQKYLYIEIFGKGNAILCDEHNVIINALEHHEFKDRIVKPRLKYVYPISDYNFLEIKEKELLQMLKNSKRESIVTSLATELGLGGVYSEEACLISNIDKSKAPNELDEKEIELLFSAIEELSKKKINAYVVFDNDKIIDYVPFEMKFYSGKILRKFESFSDAVLFFYSNFRPEKESLHDKKIKELLRIIEAQKTTIEEVRKEERKSREKGEIIYQNYQVVKEVIEEINKASKKYSWKEIKAKLKDHKLIKEINEKDRKIVIDLN